MSEAQPNLLIIGYGNTLRRDDGAGVALAKAVAAQWQAQGQSVCLNTVQQLTPELAVEIANDEVAAVVFVDAAATANGDKVGIRRLQADAGSPSLGHHLDPATLLAYVRLFRPALPPVWLVTIGGEDFRLGEGFSAVVAQHLAAAPDIASDLLARISEDLSPCTK